MGEVVIVILIKYFFNDNLNFKNKIHFKIMKKIAHLFMLLFLIVESKSMAQKIIPFQYQSQKQWNNNAAWGYMNEDRKIIFTPFLNTLTPKVNNGKYRNCNEGIKDITTGKIIIDSVQAIGTYDIKGNLLSVKNPKYSGYYSRFSVTNMVTKKTIATSALSFTNIPNYTLIRNFDETDIKHREGVIDENGKEIIPLKYDKIKGNGFGFFAVYDNKLDDDKKMLVKYLVGANYTELYLTYLDENLKPYSIIKD